jgi:hypothetical protein
MRHRTHGLADHCPLHDEVEDGHDQQGNDEYQDFLGPYSDSEHPDHIVPEGGRDHYRAGAPNREADALEDDAEAEGGHHPGHAGLAGKGTNRQHVEEQPEEADPERRNDDGDYLEPSADRFTCEGTAHRLPEKHQHRADADEGTRRDELAVSEVERLGGGECNAEG